MKIQAKAALPTKYGTFDMIAFSDEANDLIPHVLLIHPEADLSKSLTVRIHSECMTGDLFGSQRCDCGEQLEAALRIIEEEKGALIYHRQEGRGIGLINKIKAYNLQDQGLNTIDANIHLGFEADERAYDIPIKMLEIMGVSAIKLLTNNPEKIKVIEKSSISLTARIPVVIPANKVNKDYLDTKKNLMGHWLE